MSEQLVAPANIQLAEGVATEADSLATAAAKAATDAHTLVHALQNEPAPVTVPECTARPLVVGGVEVGKTLTVSPGTWSGSPTFAYQWERAGVAIPGATGTAYVASTADVGKPLTVLVTATNAAGAATAESPPVTVIEPAPPSPGGTWKGYTALNPMPVGKRFYEGASTPAWCNRTIPANPIVLPNSAAMRAFLSLPRSGGSGTNNPWDDGGYDHGWFFAKPDDPIVELTGVVYGSALNGRRFPCPPQAIPAPGSDKHYSVILPDGTAYHLWSASAPSGGKIVAKGAGLGNVDSGSGVCTIGGATASGIENTAGMIRPEEMRAASMSVWDTINHGLFGPASVTAANKHIWPATGGDGTSSDPNAPPQGQLFAMQYTAAEIDATSWQPWKKAIIGALAKHGWVCGDSGGGMFKFENKNDRTAYGLGSPFDWLKGTPETSLATGLGGNCTILDLYTGVDWTRLQAISWQGVALDVPDEDLAPVEHHDTAAERVPYTDAEITELLAA